MVTHAYEIRLQRRFCEVSACAGMDGSLWNQGKIAVPLGSKAERRQPKNTGGRHTHTKKGGHWIGMGTAWAMGQRGGQRKLYVWLEETIGPEGRTESLRLSLSPCPRTEELQLNWTLVTHKWRSETLAEVNAQRLFCILPLYLAWSSLHSLALPPQRV